MIGIKSTGSTVSQDDLVVLEPFFVHNNWLWRKKIEDGNADYSTAEIGDMVIEGIIANNAFKGEYLGGDINDINNYNSPLEYELN